MVTQKEWPLGAVNLSSEHPQLSPRRDPQLPVLGSPMHLTLRKWVWAWFKFPPSVARSRLPSTKLLRRNPVALAIEWQERLDKGAALTRADLAYQTKVTSTQSTRFW